MTTTADAGGIPPNSGPIATQMRQKLTQAFAPTLLVIEDQSHQHKGHGGASRPDGSHGETHFHVIIVSTRFHGLSRVARQRLVYDTLAVELAGAVHALSLAARTPDEA